MAALAVVLLLVGLVLLSGALWLGLTVLNWLGIDVSMLQQWVRDVVGAVTGLVGVGEQGG